ncbi:MULTISPECIES: polysaccharide deacetylase family protein [Sutcliffiella]|nr:MULTISPECIES: polysaccharide deacetylase family protein [Sutcliffiella]WBL17300.1 polysaccharide deacetylase [Sutcliffiella sp. NC1]
MTKKQKRNLLYVLPLILLVATIVAFLLVGKFPFDKNNVIVNLNNESIIEIPLNQDKVAESEIVNENNNPAPEVNEEIVEEPMEEQEEKVTEAQDEERIAYLTFDDGPQPITEELLNILAEYNAKATFFMLEPQMVKHKEIVERMVEEGHTLALHGVSHDKKQFYASQFSVINEMRQSQQTVKDITNVETVIIRTPFGSSPHMTPSYKDAVKKEGFILWDWNVDSRDWQFRGPEYISHTLLQVEEVVNRGENPVILLHDLISTVDFITVLLDELVEMGFVFKNIDEAMEPIELK